MYLYSTHTLSAAAWERDHRSARVFYPLCPDWECVMYASAKPSAASRVQNCEYGVCSYSAIQILKNNNRFLVSAPVLEPTLALKVQFVYKSRLFIGTVPL